MFPKQKGMRHGSEAVETSRAQKSGSKGVQTARTEDKSKASFF